ncbi:MAG: hypothetical protein ABIN48_03705, partial [Ginsengibacter sp.]
SSRNPIAQQKTNVTDGLKNEQRNAIKISPNQQIANLDTPSENKKEGLVDETKPKTIQRAGIVEKDRNENQAIAKYSTNPSDAVVIEDVSPVDKSTKKQEQNNTELIAQIPQKKNVKTGIISNSDLRNIDIDLTPEILGEALKESNYVHLDVDKAPSSNYIFYNVTEEEFRRSKIGGFLKKVKRIAERNDPVKRLFESESDQIVSNKQIQ